VYIGFQHLHSSLAYVALALLIGAFAFALVDRLQHKPYSNSLKKLALWALIGSHLQLVIGLALYFISPLGFSNFSGVNMSNAIARLYMLEHPVMMIIAIIAITIGYSKSKKEGADARRQMMIILGYGIGLVLILSRIPWFAWPSFLN
jgi:hypothetical protein